MITSEVKERIEQSFKKYVEERKLKYDTPTFYLHQEAYINGVMAAIGTEDIPPFYVIAVMSRRPIYELVKKEI